MKPVVCLGGLTIDEIYHVPAFPEIDDAQPILEFVESYGGRGALVAITLGMLDVPVSLFTAAGNDFEQKGYEHFLRKNKVNLGGMIKCTGDACFGTKVFVADRRDAITFFQMRNLWFGEPSQVHRELIDSAEVLYFAINDLEFNLDCLAYASDKRKTIIHNLSSQVIFNQVYLSQAMQNSDVLILNEVEFRNLCKIERGGVRDIFGSHSRLRHFIVTKGKTGSSLYSREKDEIKETKIEPVLVEQGGTPLGLGDAYSAGIVYGICNGWSLDEAAHFGSHLGAASFESRYSFIENHTLEKYKQRFEEERG